MIILFRFVILAAWAFWLGGFVFYTAIVVPASMRVLERHPTQPVRVQGFVTREVAVALNVSGIVAVSLFALETLRTRRVAGRLAWLTFLLVALMAVGLVALFQLHGPMDRMLDTDAETVSDPAQFYTLHRQYLWISTLQWGVGVVYLFLLPPIWRREDRWK